MGTGANGGSRELGRSKGREGHQEWGKSLGSESGAGMGDTESSWGHGDLGWGQWDNWGPASKSHSYNLSSCFRVQRGDVEGFGGVPRGQWDLGEVPELGIPTSNEPLLLQALERGPFDDEAPQPALHPLLLRAVRSRGGTWRQSRPVGVTTAPNPNPKPATLNPQPYLGTWSPR